MIFILRRSGWHTGKETNVCYDIRMSTCHMHTYYKRIVITRSKTYRIPMNFLDIPMNPLHICSILNPVAPLLAEVGRGSGCLHSAGSKWCAQVVRHRQHGHRGDLLRGDRSEVCCPGAWGRSSLISMKMDGWMDEWMDGWIHGWMFPHVIITMYIYI